MEINYARINDVFVVVVVATGSVVDHIDPSRRSAIHLMNVICTGFSSVKGYSFAKNEFHIERHSHNIRLGSLQSSPKRDMENLGIDRLLGMDDAIDDISDDAFSDNNNTSVYNQYEALAEDELFNLYDISLSEWTKKQLYIFVGIVLFGVILLTCVFSSMCSSKES